MCKYTITCSQECFNESIIEFIQPQWIRISKSKPKHEWGTSIHIKGKLKEQGQAWVLIWSNFNRVHLYIWIVCNFEVQRI